jgi:pSer/pThr/pTyr-binding forkhead associated (FHA) protein
MTEDKLNALYCPKCGHKNELSAPRCAKCGLVFPSTIPVDDLLPEEQPVTTLEATDVRAQLAKAGTIVLSIAGHDRPLFVRRQPEITLGRSAPGEEAPTIDLNPFRGQKMGVSRRHAAIRLSEGKALIEDLGSVNGTWLNENRLEPRQPHPLHNGDYVRLGHLIIVVHASAIDTLILIDTSTENDKRLTTKVLVERVGPFLQAVTDLQSTINTLSGQKASPVTVHSMNAGSKGAIHVRLSGATQGIDLVREEVIPWRRRYAQLVSDTKQLETSDKDTTSPTSEAKSVRSRYANAYRMLFQAVLNRIAPGKSEEDLAPHRPTLTEALTTLAFNPLEMSDSTVSGDVVEAESSSDDTGTRTLLKKPPSEGE